LTPYFEIEDEVFNEEANMKSKKTTSPISKDKRLQAQKLLSAQVPAKRDLRH